MLEHYRKVTNMQIYDKPNVVATFAMSEILTEAFGGSGCEDMGHNSDGCQGIGDVKKSP